jgi:tetratricopeptide (TPR) repeat protein
MAGRAADLEAARRLLGESITLYEELGDTHAAARVTARLGRVDFFTDRRDEAMASMERAFAVIQNDEPDEDLAALAARLSLGYWYRADLEHAAELVELALDIAEAHSYPRPLVVALRAKGALAESRGHHEESMALQQRALQLSLEHDLFDEASTSYFILSDRCFRRDAYVDALGYLDDSLALARRHGNRPFESGVLAERTYPMWMLGRWDEAQETRAGFTQEQIDSGGMVLSLMESSMVIQIERGELDGARAMFAMFSRLEGSTDVQDLSCYLGSRAALRRAEGRLAEALADAEQTIEVGRTLGVAGQSTKQGIVEGVEAALALGDVAKAEGLLQIVDGVPAGTRSPYLDAQAKRFRARMADDASGFESAAATFQELGLPFWLAVTLLEHGELTGDSESLDKAREIFEELQATPWLERLDAVSGKLAEPVPASS